MACENGIRLFFANISTGPFFLLAHPPPPTGEEVLAYGLNRYVPLNRVQFSGLTCSAAHLVFKENKFCQFTPKCYNWLPIAYQIVFKILLLTFKAINKLAKTYISELVSLKDSGGWGEGGSNYLRLNDGKLLNIPSCKSIFFNTW